MWKINKTAIGVEPVVEREVYIISRSFTSGEWAVVDDGEGKTFSPCCVIEVEGDDGEVVYVDRTLVFRNDEEHIGFVLDNRGGRWYPEQDGQEGKWTPHAPESIVFTIPGRGRATIIWQPEVAQPRYI